MVLATIDIINGSEIVSPRARSRAEDNLPISTHKHESHKDYRPLSSKAGCMVNYMKLLIEMYDFHDIYCSSATLSR